MTVLLKIAFRNLREHRTKTLIIGTLVAVGIAVLVFGNSLMDSAAEGIRRTYTHSFTGDLIIAGAHRSSLTFFGLTGADSVGGVMPTIPEYADVYEFVINHPSVAATSPQAIATVLLQTEDADERWGGFLFGIEPTAYEAMFPDNMELLEGRFLAPGEEGIVLGELNAKELAEDLGRPVRPGDRILMTNMDERVGIKVREVPVRGIFRFTHGDPVTEQVSLVDIGNVRALAGMKLSALSVAELSEAEAALFGQFDEEDLFGGVSDGLFGFDLLPEEGDVSPAAGDPLSLDVFFSDEFADANDAPGGPEESNAWHFLLVRLHPGASEAAFRTDVEAFFEARDLDAQVLDWLAAAGPVASIAAGFKNTFNVVVVVIAVVAIIIIMNALVISVTERRMEIGTMRALGAQKSFIRRMIAWETVLISVVFGVIGAVVGCVGLWFVSRAGLEAPNEFVEILFGGKVLQASPSARAIATSMVVVVGIGLLASLYPVSVALRTKPATAMQD